MTARTAELDAALARRWAECLHKGDWVPLAQLLDKNLAAKEGCSHRYPWNHRLDDVKIGDQAYRVSRCVTCGEQLTFTPIAMSAINPEPGVPTWLTGDALRRWVSEEEEQPAEGPVNWEVQRWRFLGEADIGVLIRSLRSGDSMDQIEVATVLGEIGSQAKDAFPVLMQLTQSDYRWLRLASAKAAWRIARNSAETLPVIVSVLRSVEDTLKKASMQKDNALGEFLTGHTLSSFKEIIEFLGEMGAEARPAVPELFRLLEDNSLDIRDPILAALARIQKDSDIAQGRHE
jgi:hypothetical protein